MDGSEKSTKTSTMQSFPGIAHKLTPLNAQSLPGNSSGLIKSSPIRPMSVVGPLYQTRSPPDITMSAARTSSFAAALRKLAKQACDIDCNHNSHPIHLQNSIDGRHVLTSPPIGHPNEDRPFDLHHPGSLHTNSIHSSSLHSNQLHSTSLHYSTHPNSVHPSNVHPNNVHPNAVHSNTVSSSGMHSNTVHPSTVHLNPVLPNSVHPVHSNSVHSNSMHSSVHSNSVHSSVLPTSLHSNTAHSSQVLPNVRGQIFDRHLSRQELITHRTSPCVPVRNSNYGFNIEDGGHLIPFSDPMTGGVFAYNPFLAPPLHHPGLSTLTHPSNQYRFEDALYLERYGLVRPVDPNHGTIIQNINSLPSYPLGSLYSELLATHQERVLNEERQRLLSQGYKIPFGQSASLEERRDFGPSSGYLNLGPLDLTANCNHIENNANKPTLWRPQDQEDYHKRSYNLTKQNICNKKRAVEEKSEVKEAEKGDENKIEVVSLLDLQEKKLKERRLKGKDGDEWSDDEDKKLDVYIKKGPPLPLDESPMKLAFFKLLGLITHRQRQEIEFNKHVRRKKYVREILTNEVKMEEDKSIKLEPTDLVPNDIIEENLEKKFDFMSVLGLEFERDWDKLRDTELIWEGVLEERDRRKCLNLCYAKLLNNLTSDSINKCLNWASKMKKNGLIEGTSHKVQRRYPINSKSQCKNGVAHKYSKNWMESRDEGAKDSEIAKKKIRKDICIKDTCKIVTPDDGGNQSSNLSFKWPGVDSVIEAYEKYSIETSQEKEFLSDKLKKLRINLQEMNIEADVLNKKMTGLLRAKKELETERDHYEKKIGNLKKCLQDMACCENIL